MQLQGHHGLLGIHALWVALPELTWRFASADPVDRRARRGARAGGQPREPGRRRGGASLFWGGHTKSQRPPDRESWAWGLSGVGPCGFLSMGFYAFQVPRKFAAQSFRLGPLQVEDGWPGATFGAPDVPQSWFRQRLRLRGARMFPRKHHGLLGDRQSLGSSEEMPNAMNLHVLLRTCLGPDFFGPCLPDRCSSRPCRRMLTSSRGPRQVLCWLMTWN